MSEAESAYAVRRIQKDRGDGKPTPFSWKEILKHFLDPKIYGFAAAFFLLVRIKNGVIARVLTSTDFGAESCLYCAVLLSSDNVCPNISLAFCDVST